MSSMKQVVYAGAFGALVAMQGCGDDTTPAEVTVEADGATNLKQDVDTLVTDAKEVIEKFDASVAVAKITEVAEKNGVDVEDFQKKLNEGAKQVTEMDADALQKHAHEVFDQLMKSEEVVAAKASLESIFKDLMPTEMSFEDAKAKLTDFCSKAGAAKFGPKDTEASKNAVEFVQALKAAHKKMDGKYNEEVAATLLKCNPGFQWSSLPCMGVKYSEVTVEQMKIKQGYELPKGHKAGAQLPKTKKNIYDIMPSQFPERTDITEVLDYIQSECKETVKVNLPTLKTLARAVMNTQQKPKPEKAAKAVQSGKKEAKKEAAPAPAPTQA